MAKKEKWKVAHYDGEKSRYVVDQDNTLIADCYAYTAAEFGLPENYKKLAKRIALLPDLERVLAEVYDSIPWGHPAHTKAATLLDKIDKLKK